MEKKKLIIAFTVIMIVTGVIIIIIGVSFRIGTYFSAEQAQQQPHTYRQIKDHFNEYPPIFHLYFTNITYEIEPFPEDLFDLDSILFPTSGRFELHPDWNFTILRAYLQWDLALDILEFQGFSTNLSFTDNHTYNHTLIYFKFFDTDRENLDCAFLFSTQEILDKLKRRSELL